ncbi:hypothetical protein CRYUN_Cryun23aG0160700 [Craigia yunnanensis]
MYSHRDRGGGSSKSELVRGPLDRKRINDALDKHLEKSSPSTSRGLNSKDKERSSVPSTSIGKPQLDHRGSRSAALSKAKCSDEEFETDSEESDISGSDGDDTSWISWFCNLRGDMFTEEQNELVESAAEMLYGLIHVRYILTSKGMSTMLEKYKNYDFGRCPGVYCCGQPCLPVGQSDIPRSDIDGAYVGTTFPHLFLMTYGHLKPQKPTQNYIPRVFGFKIHKP